MNSTSIFSSLVFLSVFHASVQDKVWPLRAAEVKHHTYKNQVSLQSLNDNTYVIRALLQNATTPTVVHGPFKVRGFGPYSMMIVKMWLNTDVYVSVSFHDPLTARQFYHVLNPYHSPSFLNAIKIHGLTVQFESFDGFQKRSFEKSVPNALDIFILDSSAGVDSRARSFVVHNVDDPQEIVLIFHSFELEMFLDGDKITMRVHPLNCPQEHRISMRFESPSIAKEIVDTHKFLKGLGLRGNLKDLEALPWNTYPTKPPNYEEGGPSSTRG